MKLYKFSLAFVWLIITIILLTLPGEDLPKPKLFDGFDKVVHFGMFSLLTYLFCQPLKRVDLSEKYKKNWFLKTAVLVLIYGIIMEFVQKYLVRDRSFDVIDILFDGLGSFAAYFWSYTFLIKKKTVA